MNEAARNVVLLLQELAEREHEAEEFDASGARVRETLSALVEPSVAQRFGYARYEVDWFGFGHLANLQGLVASQSKLLPMEIVDQLCAMDEEELAPLLTETGLTFEQLHAAFFAAFWILSCLGWESRDRSVPAEFPPAKRKSMVDACLRSLRCFRETGEP